MLFLISSSWDFFLFHIFSNALMEKIKDALFFFLSVIKLGFTSLIILENDAVSRFTQNLFLSDFFEELAPIFILQVLSNFDHCLLENVRH